MKRNVINKRFLSLVLSISVVLSSLLGTAVMPASALTLSDTKAAIQVTQDSSGADYDYSSLDFSSFGDNLITDPTVSSFNTDNTYKNYYVNPPSDYTIANADAWWDNPANDYQAYSANATVWGSMKARGYAVNDSTLSHTDDGSGVINITTTGNQTYLPLPKMVKYSYYLVTFWVKFDSSKNNDIEFQYDYNGGLITNYSMFGSNDWERLSILVYTGSSNYSEPNIRIYNNGVGYVDDVAVYKLDSQYGADCMVSGKLVYETEAQDKLSRGFAPYGYGDRQYYSAYTCDDANNLIENSACDSTDFWADSEGLLTVSSDDAYEGTTSLKFNGNGTYQKTVSGLKANTYYYLSLYAKACNDDAVCDANFGFMSPGGYPLENPIGEWEESHWAREEGSKQEITVFCPDATWYNRTYRFYTGDYTQLDFFITGTAGTMYLDDIRIFEEANGVSANTSVDAEDINVLSTEESSYACDASDNLITNGDFEAGAEFWEDFSGYGKFVEVVTSSGNGMLHYKGADLGYYYMAKADIKADTEYTFSFWTMNLNGNGAKFGVISLNDPLGYISGVRNVSDDYGSWKLVSIRFTAHTDTTVALAIYDGGGEAVFDNVRLFESSKGYVADNDTPTGGELFTGSSLGSDGMQIELPDDASAKQITYSGSTIYDYSAINYDCYGENLITDPTVSAFDAQGNYKSYYSLDENGEVKLDDFGKNIVANADAWWDNPANDYQVLNANSSTWYTMKTKGYTVNSGSRTSDGSGSIYITGTEAQNYLALPRMEKKSYYLISLWVKFEKAAFSTASNNEIAFMYSTSDSASVNYNKFTYSMFVSTDWEQISFLVYTGNSSYSEPVIRIYNNYAGYVDDVSMYKLSPYYGRLSHEAGTLLTPDYENLGDINDDDAINTKDLVRLKKVLAGITDQYSIMNIDVSYDGYISSMDLATMKKFLLGKILVFK